jgi:hypothetical protein
MEEDFGEGQGLTKGCGAKGRRRINIYDNAKRLVYQKGKETMVTEKNVPY